ETVASEFRLAPQIALHPDLAPEVVDAQREEGQEEVDDGDAEERAGRAMEGEPVGRSFVSADWNGGFTPPPSLARLSDRHVGRRLQGPPAGATEVSLRSIRLPALVAETDIRTVCRYLFCQIPVPMRPWHRSPPCALSLQPCLTPGVNKTICYRRVFIEESL